jgi:hypothetical protein
VKPPFRAEGTRLFLAGEEILIGGELEMQIFALWLNSDIPKDMHELRSRLQGMIMVSRGGSFVMSSALRELPDDILSTKKEDPQ